jgi:RHS repeat-associated protein
MLITRTLQWLPAVGSQTVQSGASTADMESSYTYDNEGRMLTVQYPGSEGAEIGGQSPSSTPGPSLAYAYDTMGRLNTMTDNTPGLGFTPTVVSGATYDPANRLLGISGSYYTESRSYNVMGQLTTLTSNSVNITYAYSATQNNGKITSQTDNVSGEQVVYAYDALNRLASATAGSTWGQSYSYDGFGNLTNQNVTAGTAPSLSVSYNSSTNLQTTDCADANGNILGTAAYNCPGSGQLYTYDVSNRLVSVPGGTQYAHAPGNKRIWKGTLSYNQYTGTNTLSQDVITFWSVTGHKLGDYNITGDPNVVYSWNNYNGFPTPTVTFAMSTANYYFGGKLIGKGTPSYFGGGFFVGSDRLGSMGKYYPWGQERPSATTNNTEKFTGYFRDAETTLDYAVNRYHQPGMGRFLTPDRKRRSAHGSRPGSWNRYSYTHGDPVNRVDRKGGPGESRRPEGLGGGMYRRLRRERRSSGWL